MPNLIARLNDFEYDVAIKDGDYDATLLKHYIKEAETPVVLKHELGRPPIKVDIVFSSCPIMSPQIDSVDDKSVILKFFEQKTTVIMRFE